MTHATLKHSGYYLFDMGQEHLLRWDGNWCHLSVAFENIDELERYDSSADAEARMHEWIAAVCYVCVGYMDESTLLWAKSRSVMFAY